jgi:hypothetical protein
MKATSETRISRVARPSKVNGDGDTHQGESERDLISFVRLHLRQVVTIQHELLSRLLDEQYKVPLNLGEAFEDAGNRFLDLAEMISQRHLESRQEDPAGD